MLPCILGLEEGPRAKEQAPLEAGEVRAPVLPGGFQGEPALSTP